MMKWWHDLNPWVRGLIIWTVSGGAMAVQAAQFAPTEFNLFTVEGFKNIFGTFASGAVIAFFTHIARSPLNPKDEPVQPKDSEQ